MNLYPPMQYSWVPVFREEAEKPYMQTLKQFIYDERQRGVNVLPSLSGNVFKALDMTSLWTLKCVVIGEDPYSQKDMATGIAFGVPFATPKKNWPGSLKNISRAMKVDLGHELINGDLVGWAQSGVLLLNRILTVEQGQPSSHSNKGWERFTEAVCKTVIDSGRPVIWVLWGKGAQEGIMPLLEQFKAFDKGHEVITSCHPSPQSVNDGFVWHKPFSKVNAFCDKMGYSRIRWEG